MAVRIQFRRGTAAEWAAANPTLAAGELGYESDTGQFKIGTGSQNWNALSYGAVSESYVDNAIANVIDLAPGTLDTLNELAAALGDDPDFFNTVANNLYDHTADTNVHGIENTLELTTTFEVENLISQHSLVTTNVHGIANVADLITTAEADNLIDQHNVTENVHGIANTLELTTTFDVDNAITLHSQNITNVHGIANTADLVVTADLGVYALIADGSLSNVSVTGATFTGTVSLPSDTSIGDISAAEISRLDNVSSNIQSQLDTKLTISNAANTYAPIANATLSGTVSLPETTSIGNVTYDEIGHLNGVTSAIQTQLDAKLATSSAASIYAPLSDPTFISSVTLPANTSVGSVSSTEISYLDGVTSAIQDQLDDKAPIASPTFTGTVSGITATMVGLGNVDNTSDADKPISTATQTALDAKLNLAGGTMTGKITLDGDPSQALHAATKQYVDNISAGLHIHEAAHAATTDTLANLISSTVTYDNGTDGVGATLTLGASLTTLDGHTLNNGDRILVKNQANAAHNGIYVRTSGTVLTRADDFNSSIEIAGGDFVFVENGTLYNSTAWVVENEVTTVGTDDILWAQFAGAGTITAGTNITVNGLQVSVVSNPTFANVVTASSGVAFSDGTQTKAGVPSLTTFTEKTASYTLDTLAHQDSVVEINSSSATTFTIPANADLAWPVGASMDILQTGTGQVTIAGAVGVTVNSTPGLKLRTRWSSCTIMKRGTDSWIVYGDLTA